MPKRAKPHVHGRDHEHGGADTTMIHYEDVGDPGGGGGGGGIQFDTANVGGWLAVETTDTSDGLPTGDGIRLDADLGDITINAAADDVNLVSGDDIELSVGHDFNLLADRDANITAQRDVTISTVAGLILLLGLPTSDPAVAHALWNDAGVVRIS